MNTVQDEASATTSPAEVFNMWQVEYAMPPPPFTITVEVCMWTLAWDGSPTLLGRKWMQELGIGISDVEANVHALSDVEHLV